MSAPILRTPKNEDQLVADEQTPTKECRFHNDGGLRASGTASHLTLSFKTAPICRLAFFHAVAAAVHGDDLCLTKQPIEQRRSKDLISSQQLAPASKAGVRS